MKKAQSEMVGFGMIIILVAIIGLVFLWFYIVKPAPQNLEDYEAQSFVRALSQYTTECKEPGRDYLKIDELIYFCYDPLKQCESGEACTILENTLNSIAEESWDTGEGKRIRGYSLEIAVFDLNGDFVESMYSKTQGNLTGNSRGFEERYLKKSKWFRIIFNAYY